MKGKNGYILYSLVTVAVMIMALLVPSLRLPAADISDSDTSSSPASGYEDGNTSYPDTIEKEGSSLTYLEKIQAVGATNAKYDGYMREKIEYTIQNETESSEQFTQIIQKLYENDLIDEAVYSDLLRYAPVQAVTEYSYTKDSDPLFTVRIIDRIYYNVSLCSKIAISVGLDRDTGGVIYLYLNFYGLYDKVDVENSATKTYVTNWPRVLGFTDFTTDYFDELNTSNSLRVHAEYQLDDSSTIYYKFGFWYESREDRYQIFMEPAAS